jgi:membrane-bound lytic murein transglycosylase B
VRRLALLIVVALAGCGGEDAPAPPPPPRPAQSLPPVLPAPDAPLPRDPDALAASLAETAAGLDAAIDRWDQAEPAPREVALLALHEQRVIRLLTDRPRLYREVHARTRAALRHELRDNVLARRELGLITSVRRGPPPRIRVGPAAPAAELRRHYAAAHRRFGVRPALLAAINHVESAFGRLRNRSISGARGPMQFMPATWEEYGMGGDINDPRDAIMGAANYLHASGAPGNEAKALFHYNPSSDYVSAVRRIARQIRRDWRRFSAYYAWQVYVGSRRMTEPPG